MSPLVKAAGAALLGALIGAGIWAGITYATNREVGFIAWGIGGLVGLAVRYAAQESEGPKFGVLAAGVAILAIVAGKFLAVSLLVSSINIGDNIQVTDQDMIVQQADEICKDRQAKGKRVNFPAGMALEKAHKREDYPTDVWQEATKKWNALGPAEQQRLIAEEKKEIEQFAGELKGELRNIGFRESFSPFDILWFLLATITAYRLGAGTFSPD
jgi:hypothetical protein